MGLRSSVFTVSEGNLMNRIIATLGLSAVASIIDASPSLAGIPGPAPAPLLGAGLPGVAVLAVAGGGYLAVRAFRRRRD
jgi:hypothetical protein